MKKINKFSKKILAVLAFFFSIAAFSQNQGTDFTTLPHDAQKFITTNFNQRDVSYIKTEKKYKLIKEYDVYLKNGTEIEFDSKGNWTEVDGKQQEISTRFLPKSINQYVKKTFPKTYITKVEKKRRGYEVKISNGLELLFNSNGEFLKID